MGDVAVVRLYAVCCVLCAVLCAVCCVLCAVLCVVCCVLCMRPPFGQRKVR